MNLDTDYADYTDFKSQDKKVIIKFKVQISKFKVKKRCVTPWYMRCHRYNK